MIHISDEITLLIHLWEQTQNPERARETHPDRSVASQSEQGRIRFIFAACGMIYLLSFRYSSFLMAVIRNNFTFSALCMRSFIIFLF